MPTASIYTNNSNTAADLACIEFPITEHLSDNDFIVGKIGDDYADMPNIARIEIYDRVLTTGEIMSLTNGCNLIADGTTSN